jgi:hypothetical protein
MTSTEEQKLCERVREATECIDELMAMGNVEQCCILGFRFEEMTTHAQAREKYLKEKWELLRGVNKLIESTRFEEGSRDDEFRHCCTELSNKAMRLKLQNSENMSLLNQIKAFFFSFLGPQKNVKSYNASGKLRDSGSSFSLITKKA